MIGERRKVPNKEHAANKKGEVTPFEKRGI
jgi:hypothetical protein